MKITAAEDLYALASSLIAQYRHFVGIFCKAAQVSLPTHVLQNMPIDLKIRKQPPSRKLYPLSPNELKLLKEYLDKMLPNGKIRPCKSSAGDPIFFAKQANGKLPIVVSYCGLNAITIEDKYLPPLMTTLMEQLGISQVFPKLNLKLCLNLL